MPVVRSADTIVHDLHGARFVSYATPSRSSSKELCAWRLEVPGALTGVVHTITREEVFLVLTGSPRLTIDGEPHTLTAGDVAIAHAGSSIGLDNPADEPATVWVTTSTGLQGVLTDGSWITPPWAS